MRYNGTCVVHIEVISWLDISFRWLNRSSFLIWIFWPWFPLLSGVKKVGFFPHAPLIWHRPPTGLWQPRSFSWWQHRISSESIRDNSEVIQQSPWSPSFEGQSIPSIRIRIQKMSPVKLFPTISPAAQSLRSCPTSLDWHLPEWGAEWCWRAPAAQHRKEPFGSAPGWGTGGTSHFKAKSHYCTDLGFGCQFRTGKKKWCKTSKVPQFRVFRQIVLFTFSTQ